MYDNLDLDEIDELSKNKIIIELIKENKHLEKLVNAHEKIGEYSDSELESAYKTLDAFEQLHEFTRQEIIQLKRELSDVHQVMHEPLAKDIMKLLNEDNTNEEHLINQIKLLQKQNEVDNIYQVLLKILTNLTFSLKEAEKHWDKILEHRINMTKRLGRKISFRVAMLDYFIIDNQQLKNPKIIEIKMYEKTVLSALIDMLTGIYNRRYYDDIIKRELSRAKRHKINLTIFLADIDDFKKYNDRFGHVEGDIVLEDFASLLINTFRKDDICCRYGGEEFIVIMPNTTNENAFPVIHRLQEKLNRKKFKKDVKITFSGGLATFPDDAEDDLELFKKVDLTMYYAKRKGKNRVYCYEDIPQKHNEI